MKKNQNVKCFNCGKQGHLKEIVNMEFLETMFFLSIIQTEFPSLLYYTESVVKADIELVNVGQQRTVKVTLCHWETPWGASPYVKFSSVISCHHGGNSFPEHLKNLMPIVRNHTALDDRTALKNKTKISEETINQNW